MSKSSIENSSADAIASSIPSDQIASQLDNILIFHCASTVDTTSVTLALANSIFAGESFGPIVFNAGTQLHAVTTTPAPPQQVLQALVPRAPENPKTWFQSLCHEDIGSVPLWSVLGQALLRRMVLNRFKPSAAPPKTLLLNMHLPSSQPHEVSFGMMRLLDALVRTDAVCILIIQGSDPVTLAHMAPKADMLLVERCEPDPEAVLAFSIRPKPFGKLWLSNPDPTMVSLLRQPESPPWRYEPFLTNDLLSRKALRMRKSGKTLEAIGEDLGLNRSNIKRRLDKLSQEQ